jgi:sulfate transport system ATP-binding protein
MEVADEIVVINQGTVEQIGSPDELYDRPANDFVLEFLGPVTRLGGQIVRPHDIEFVDEVTTPGAIPARVDRLVRLGFEVRVETTDEAGRLVVVQLTRGQAQRLALQPGSTVHLRAVRSESDQGTPARSRLVPGGRVGA